MGKVVAVVAYLTMWIAMAVGVWSGLQRAGLSKLEAAAATWLVVSLLAGTLSYLVRARRLAREGRPTPPFFRHVLLPADLRARVGVPRWMRVVLALPVLLCALVLLAGAALIVGKVAQGALAAPFGASVFGLVLAVLGLAFVYIAVRLYLVGDDEPLLALRRKDRAAR